MIPAFFIEEQLSQYMALTGHLIRKNTIGHLTRKLNEAGFAEKDVIKAFEKLIDTDERFSLKTLTALMPSGSNRCDYRTDNRQCKMKIVQTIGKGGYCYWHGGLTKLGLLMITHDNTYDDFLKWHGDAQVCNMGHLNPETLWAKLRGI